VTGRGYVTDYPIAAGKRHPTGEQVPTGSRCGVRACPGSCRSRTARTRHESLFGQRARSPPIPTGRPTRPAPVHTSHRRHRLDPDRI